MDDGRREFVEIAQAECHFKQDATAYLGWEMAMFIQTEAEGGGKVFHHQFGKLGACLHTYTHELDYVGVVELSKQFTLCNKPAEED